MGETLTRRREQSRSDGSWPVAKEGTAEAPHGHASEPPEEPVDEQRGRVIAEHGSRERQQVGIPTPIIYRPPGTLPRGSFTAENRSQLYLVPRFQIDGNTAQKAYVPLCVREGARSVCGLEAGNVRTPGSRVSQYFNHNHQGQQTGNDPSPQGKTAPQLQTGLRGTASGITAADGCRGRLRLRAPIVLPPTL